MSYPGAANTPAWWYGTTATNNTNATWNQSSLTFYPQQLQQAAPAARPSPKTNVELLRERVSEVCDLAFEVAG